MTDTVAEKAVSMLGQYGPRMLAEMFNENTFSLIQRMHRCKSYAQKKREAIAFVAEMSKTMSKVEIDEKTGWSVYTIRDMLRTAGVFFDGRTHYRGINNVDSVKVVPPTPEKSPMNKLLMRKWA